MAIPSTPKPQGVTTGFPSNDGGSYPAPGITQSPNINPIPFPGNNFSNDGAYKVPVPADNFTDGPV